MTPLTLLSILLISIFFFTLYHFFLSLLSLHTNPNSTSPPPLIKSHPIIGNFFAYYANRRRLLHWYTSLLSSSQTLTLTLTRLGARRTVITADPANVEHILKTNFPNYPKGPAFTDILGDLLGRGIFASDGPCWLHQRKLASHHFSARNLRSLVLSSIECGTHRRLLPSLLSAAAEARSHLDLQELLKQLTFDVICMITLGVDSAEVAPLGPAFEEAAAVSAQRGAAPVFAVWKAKRALNIGSERRLRSAIRYIHTTIMEIVTRRRKELEVEDKYKNKRNDVLSELISGGHSDDVIRDMVVSFVMAGRDTTSAALTWFFWLVSGHPEVEAEILKEIRQCDAGDYNGLKEMKVLEASLLETMRLYPPVVWDSKYAEEDDVLPDGTRVRRGDRVTYFPYGMGRMERIWGKDWGDFRPGRWSTTEGGEGRKSVYEYPVFQAGPRVCLGKEMAFVQMKYVAAAVLGRFELRRREGEEEVGPPEVVPLMTAHMAGGLNVVVKERERERERV